MVASLQPLIVLSFLSLFISSSAAQTSFRPKALVLAVTKDVSASTPQYVTKIKQRTPLVPVKLTVDLGGGYFWVNCEEGYASSTSKPSRCGSAQCSLFGLYGCSGDKICGRSPSNTVTGVSTYGDIHADVVSVNSTDGNTPGRVVSVPNTLFICGSKVVQNGLASGVTGMAGLGRTKVSLPSQFASAFSFPRKFAICLSSSTMTDGVMFFGDGPYNLNKDVSKVLTFTPLITNPVSTAPSAFLGEPSVEYFIGVKSIRISDKNVPLNTTLLSIDRNGIGGTKISTVNPYTIMETTIYKAVSEAFVKALGAPTVAPVAPFGTCFATKDISFSRMGPAVPTINLVLQNEEVVWNIIGANSMVQFNDINVICLGFVDAGSSPSAAQVGFVAGGSHPMTSITIGAHQLENNLLQFDLAASRLGFRSLFLEVTNCANFNFTSSARI
ncbi:basic 7S globulin-like [Abrus precatorius]|uniref:Basic 7S globulin-like n=1 Tax=Abrus precatorius TaxID=3816 RepID=A0A8B8MB96_ABRPR|nr:basic 7S globulin-like [Abrus precatorius]